MITIAILCFATGFNSWVILYCMRNQRKVTGRLVDVVLDSTESIHKKLDAIQFERENSIIATKFMEKTMDKQRAANRKPRTDEQRLKASLDKKAYWEKKRAERATTPPVVSKELVS